MPKVFDIHTSYTLLHRLRHGDDHSAWSTFLGAYVPMIRAWGVRQGLPANEADDFASEVLITLSKVLPGLEYKPSDGRFRSWLKAVVIRKAISYWRANRRYALTSQGAQKIDFTSIPDPATCDDSEYARTEAVALRMAVAAEIVTRVRGRFSDLSWQAFERMVLYGEPAKTVADALNLRFSAVTSAKYRVLKALRDEGRSHILPAN